MVDTQNNVVNQIDRDCLIDILGISKQTYSAIEIKKEELHGICMFHY